jgi:hypothetical protein
MAYPGVIFKSKDEWQSTNTALADGMNQLVSTLKDKKDGISRQRSERGVNKKFSNLPSKALPDR